MRMRQGCHYSDKRQVLRKPGTESAIYAEDEPLGGSDPYSSSKACAELVTTAYRRSFLATDNESKSLPVVATVRAGNVIGGGDWARTTHTGLHPSICRQSMC